MIFYTWQFWLVLTIIIIIILWIFCRNKGDNYEPKPVRIKDIDRLINKKKPRRIRKRNNADTSNMSTRDTRHTQQSNRNARLNTLKSIDQRGRNIQTDLINQVEPAIIKSSRDCVPSTLTARTKGRGHSRNSVITNIDLTPELPEGLVSLRPEDIEKGSKGEMECRRVLEAIYGVKFNKIRPNWLINDKTGRALELDGYNEELKMAFEYNGEQHYKSNHYFHRSYQDFVNQVYRDEIKIDICDRMGVYVITVPYNVPFNDIEGYIRYYLPEAVQQRQMRLEQL